MMFHNPSGKVLERRECVGRGRDSMLAQGVADLEDVGCGQAIGCELARFLEGLEGEARTRAPSSRSSSTLTTASNGSSGS